MSLDFSPLANAINQLEKSLDYATSPLAINDPGLFEQLRNSVIQCFKFTYELSHKMLKRFLEETAASTEDINTRSFQELIRTGNEKGLLRSDWLVWRTYRQARNNSSHTYDADKAEQVYQIAPDFLLEAKHLYQQLIARSNKE
ncbi:nucleotidyltransferase [Methyloprofundus sedimenti]|uniref:Nucleotidyltransferase n=1 Tax=Methyloprofundus sedimenti TaxID=1420851 RepID=A0A1V8M0V2_9GAMM|nr:HI0074 family nucleotidyltransferase substrate-binding subunit [Methyloprofundus sedimenti]OQK15169.1 nucleotidyltransferase [Methyloprofundus sedimenti]